MKQEQTATTVGECIGIAVREWRTERGMTQTEAASLLHMTQSALSKIEAGQRRPPYETLFGAGCSIDALFVRAGQIALRDCVYPPAEEVKS